MRLRDLEGFKDQGSLDALRGDWHAIQADPDNDLRDLTTKDNRAHIERLKDSLSTFGWRQGENMIVRVDESSTPPIVYAIDGKCRLVALAELEVEGRPFPGKVTVIQVQRGTDRKKRMLMILSSGSDRKNLSDIEFASGLYRSIEFGYTEQEVCDEMGWKAIGTLHNHLDVLTLKPELRMMVEEGKISRTEALRLQRMTPDADPGEIMRTAEEEHKRLNKKGPVKIKPRHTKAVTKPKTPKPPVEAKPETKTVLQSTAQPELKRTVLPKLESEAGTAARTEAAASVASLTRPVQPDQEEAKPDQDVVRVAPTYLRVPEGATAASPVPRNAIKDLLAALKPFADLCNDFDANAKADDDIVEVLFADIKKAWSVYTAATGGQEEEAA